jgi:asparagine synthase (glutamine-hydrolysing)
MYGEPFADSSQIPTFLVSQLARQHVTVALSGDGGDEMFAGYDRHLLHSRLEQTRRRVPAVIRRGASAGLTKIAPETWDRLSAGPFGRLLPGVARQRTGAKAHRLARILGDSPGGLYRDLMAMNPDDALLAGEINAVDDPYRMRDELSHLPPIEQSMLLDTLTYLPEDILTKVDRASMAVSLEVRVPLLDPSIFAFAWELHPGDRVRDGRGKWVLRRLLHRYVPESLVERPKMGFGVPVGAWLRGPLRSWAEDLLDVATLEEQGYLDPVQVHALWAAHLSGLTDASYALWPVLMFQAWLAEN